MNKRCVVMVPIHKSNLEKEEERAFKNNLSVLRRWDTCLVCPENMDTAYYLQIAKQLGSKLEVRTIAATNFGTIDRYNKMMLQTEIYKIFDDYEYMLICHVDAWVFRDDLEYWLDQNYDYIGAPWCFQSRNPLNRSGVLFEPFGGNGGFNMRKIGKMIELIDATKFYPFPIVGAVRGLLPFLWNFKFAAICKNLYWYCKSYRKSSRIKNFGLIPEDVIFSKIYFILNEEYKVAPASEECFFALETKAQFIYHNISRKLPFGCHDYKRHWVEVDQYR